MNANIEENKKDKLMLAELAQTLEDRDKEIAGLNKALKAREHTIWFVAYRDDADWNGGAVHNDIIHAHPVAWRDAARSNGRDVTLLFFAKVPRRLARSGFNQNPGGYHHRSGTREPKQPVTVTAVLPLKAVAAFLDNPLFSRLAVESAFNEDLVPVFEALKAAQSKVGHGR